MGGRGTAGGGSNAMSGPERSVVDAYNALAAGSGSEWVSIADLRDRLGSMSREDVDAALRQLNRRPGITLIPESEQTSMSQRIRNARVRLGGQDKHHISIDQPNTRRRTR